MMGNHGPTMDASSGAVGMLELNLCCPACACCSGGGGSFLFAEAPCACCCGGAVRYPCGPEYEAAEAGLQPLLEEAGVLCERAPTSCGCFRCRDLQNMQRALEEGAGKDMSWLQKANQYLAQHGLRIEVCAWVTFNGKNAQSHLALQFFLLAATGK